MVETRPTPEPGWNAGHLSVGRQAAALCFRTGPKGDELLLITTRKSRRWIIPKGWLIEGLSASDTALQEAWEEAGIMGECGCHPIGRFSYVKNRRTKGPVLCSVDVFPVFVHSVAAHYPEADRRERLWLSPEKAARRVNLPDLASLLRNVGALTH